MQASVKIGKDKTINDFTGNGWFSAQGGQTHLVLWPRGQVN